MGRDGSPAITRTPVRCSAVADDNFWTARGGRVRVLTHDARFFAVSRDDRFLAWNPMPSRGEVRVAELSTTRAVATLIGAPVCALYWGADETLCVLRRAGEDMTVHLHALPDGGEIDRLTLPDLGARPNILCEASADGRVALVGSVDVSWEHASNRLYLVRARGGVTAQRFDPRPHIYEPNGTSVNTFGAKEVTPCSLSPDGTTICLAYSFFSGRPPTHYPYVCFVDVETGREDHAEYLHGSVSPDVSLLAWVGPSCVLARVGSFCGEGDLYCFEPNRAHEVARRPDDWWSYDRGLSRLIVDLHPDRGRAWLHAQSDVHPRSSPRQEWHRRAQVRLPAPDEGLTPFDPAAWGPPQRGYSGGACWSPEGATILANQSNDREAHLARADEEGASPRSLLSLRLSGARPHALRIRASPRRSLAVLTWRTEVDRWSDEGSVGLAMVGL